MARADISKANKAEVLMRLYNGGANWGATRTEGFHPMGAMMQELQERMTLEQAERLATGNVDFDYLNGRSFKVDLSGPIVDLCLYERDVGKGAAKRALEGVAGVEFIED